MNVLHTICMGQNMKNLATTISSRHRWLRRSHLVNIIHGRNAGCDRHLTVALPQDSLKIFMAFRGSMCFEIQRCGWSEVLLKRMRRASGFRIHVEWTWFNIVCCSYYILDKTRYNYIIIYQLVACWTEKEENSWYHFVIHWYIFVLRKCPMLLWANRCVDLKEVCRQRSALSEDWNMQGRHCST